VSSTSYTGGVAGISVTSDFADPRSAVRAVRSLADAGFTAAASSPMDTLFQASHRENRFMRQVVLYIILASILGTAAGAAIGAVLSYTVGPSGTEGLIIQMVSWAIFAHLIVGMWAGYLLLADRTQEDLPAVSAPRTRVLVECVSINDANRAAAILADAGAIKVTTTQAASIAALAIESRDHDQQV
jgi:MFS family permease